MVSLIKNNLLKSSCNFLILYNSVSVFLKVFLNLSSEVVLWLNLILSNYYAQAVCTQIYLTRFVCKSHITIFLLPDMHKMQKKLLCKQASQG